MRLVACSTLAVLLSGCAGAPESITLQDWKKAAMRAEYRECVRTMRREAWLRNWEERYAQQEIERTCSLHVGRPYFTVPPPPGASPPAAPGTVPPSA